jgi:hypothetical protein
MKGKLTSQRRFLLEESDRTRDLIGLPLATFWQRLLGYLVDLLLAIVVWSPLEFAWRRFLLHEEHISLVWNFHEKGNVAVMLLYWGLGNYLGNGQTPGKWRVSE